MAAEKTTTTTTLLMIIIWMGSSVVPSCRNCKGKDTNNLSHGFNNHNFNVCMFHSVFCLFFGNWQVVLEHMLIGRRNNIYPMPDISSLILQCVCLSYLIVSSLFVARECCHLAVKLQIKECFKCENEYIAAVLRLLGIIWQFMSCFGYQMLMIF